VLPAAGRRRRLHPLTPLVRGWKALAVLGAIGAQQGVESSSRGGGLPDVRIVAIVIVVVLCGGLLAGYVSWRFTHFQVEGDTLRIDTGVLFRRSRHVRLDRLQAVDVVRPVVARALGLAELRLDAAGTGDAKAPLAYLAEHEAYALRAELLARAAGIAADTPEAPERVLVEVSLPDLVVSRVLSLGFLVGTAAAVVLVAVAVGMDQGAALVAVVPAVAAAVIPAGQQFLSHYGFTVADSPDGLRIRHGLLETRAQTVPPGRVQAISLVEPLLWRRLRGWCRIELNVAGYVGQESRQETVLLPVASRRTALEVLARVLPGLDLEAIPLLPAPAAARWCDPLAAPVLGVGADARWFVSRTGRLERRTVVVPHERTQSVRLTQGWLQRRLGLATVHLDSTPGPVHPVVPHRATDEAWLILESQAERARRARSSALPERWMTAAAQG
jgi:putative membrane protein